MLVSIPVSNLIQGVSQQPPQMRLASQAAAQVNAYSSPTEGLTKRPPTQFVGLLETAPTASTALYHFIDRDTTEKYVLSVSGNSLKAWTLAGASVPVYGSSWGSAAPASWTTYMTGATSANLRMMSVADYTFIVNRSKTVAKAATLSGTRPTEALVTVTQGAYKCNYTIVIESTTIEVKTFNGQSAAAGELSTIKTDEIAEALRTHANWSALSGYTVTRYGSTLHISRGSAFTIRTTDSGGDALLIACKGSVARLSDLPQQGPDGFKIAVTPDPEVAGSAYWVKFVKDATSADGYWQETVAPGIEYVLDKATTPFVVKRKVDPVNGAFFAIEEGPWSDRTVGDVTSNPWPSFVGQTLQDVFFFKNRLGFLASDKVIMSEAGNYFNFFRTTVAQSIDSDVIDVGTLHTSVSTLRAAVPYGQHVVIFSDQAQFLLRTPNDEPLTPSSVTSVKTTEYASASVACRPVSTGKSILFMQADARFSGMREYVQTTVTTDAFEAVDLSAHVNAYVEGAPNNLAVSSYDNLAVISTSESTSPVGGTASLWNYKWLLNGNDKIQSAWSKWTFPGCSKVLGFEWFNKRLYLVMVRGSAVHLECMDFEIRVPNPASFLPHLDCLIKAGTVTWDGVTSGFATSVGSETANFSAQDVKAVIGGREVVVVSKNSTSVTVRGNATGVDTYVGIPYEMSYTFSPVYIRQQNTPILDGRLTLTYGSVSFSDTGYFRVSVANRFRDQASYEYFGGSLDAAFASDTINLDKGSFRFPIHGRNDDATVSVTSDSHFPVRLNAASFEGQFVARSRV